MQAEQEGQAIAYGRGGLWTYRLLRSGHVYVEGYVGNSDLDYSADLASLDRCEQIRQAIALLRRDGWPLDKT